MHWSKTFNHNAGLNHQDLIIFKHIIIICQYIQLKIFCLI